MVRVNDIELVSKDQLTELGQYVINGVHTDIVKVEKKVDAVNERIDGLAKQCESIDKKATRILELLEP